MGNPYTSVSVANYNANPPPDDGSTGSSNLLKWSNHITKIGDPLKTAVETINTNTLSAFGKLFGNNITSFATNATLTSSHQGRLIVASNAITITLPSAATVGTNFVVAIKNVGTATVTIDGNGTETIDGAGAITLTPDETAICISDGSNFRSIRGAPDALPRSYLAGLGLSNNATDPNNDVDIAVGECRDSADTANLVLTSALTKQLDVSWAVGSNAGGLDTGAKANNTWYHVWLIRRSDTGVVDALFSTSATSPTMPTNYDQKRRIGAVKTDGSGNIIAFTQMGDEFLWDTPVAEHTSSNPGTTAVMVYLSVPSGIQVDALITFGIQDNSPTLNIAGLVTSPDVSDTAPAVVGPFDVFTLANPGTEDTTDAVYKEVRTNTSNQIRYRLSGSDAEVTVAITTHGWRDRRGRDD